MLPSSIKAFMQASPLHAAVLLPEKVACMAAMQAAIAAGTPVDLRDASGHTPLHTAARRNNNAEAAAAAVVTLVAAGAAVHAMSEGMQPLHHAACNQNAEAATAVVEALVAAGASVCAEDRSGMQPLHLAAAFNTSAAAAAAAVVALVKAGADVHAADDVGNQPLHAAALNDDAEAGAAAVAALVEAGASVHAEDNDGWQPLHKAACNENVELTLVRALVSAGVDVRATTNDGWTPLSILLYLPPSPPRLMAAAVLVERGPAGAVLDEMCGEPPGNDMARQLVPSFLTSHATALTEAQWTSVLTLVPTPCPFPRLGRFLPDALACSEEQASELVRRLPPEDSQRLRCFALCLARWGTQFHGIITGGLPHGVRRRILSLFHCS